MKFFLISLSACATSVLAQATTTTTTNTGMTASVSMTPQQTCLAKCSPSDVTCQAICVGVPHPGDAQMNATTDCVAKCDQGDGTKEATDRYTVCQNNCISSYIILSGTAAPGGAYTTKLAPGQSTTGTVSTTTTGSSSSNNASAQASTSSSSGLSAPTGRVNAGAALGSFGLLLAAVVMH